MAVEDDPDLLAVEVDLITVLGFEAIGCLSGRDALTRLDQEPGPCLILLDLRMSGMSGHQVIDELRRRKWKGAKVVIVSAFNWSARPGDEDLVVDYLPKPFRIEECEQVLNRWCP